jgi:hypothetical protein
MSRLYAKWKAHESLTITYDSDGDAVIVLETAIGVKSKVDAELWHRLTFKTTWFLDRIGYATSWSRPLHMAVMMLIDRLCAQQKHVHRPQGPSRQAHNRRSNRAGHTLSNSGTRYRMWKTSIQRCECSQEWLIGGGSATRAAMAPDVFTSPPEDREGGCSSAEEAH